ncbi:cell division ATP-binding protein FtsE, partial [mine drainage metagenome]
MSISISPAPNRTETAPTGVGQPVRHEPPIIVFEKVTKAYPNGVLAVQDVSFTVRPRDFVFVVGPSGAGKSTVIRLLIREETADKGHVLVEGQDLARIRHRHLPRLRRKMGIVFQDFKLLPNLTVAQNVAFAIQVTDPGRSHIKEKVGEALYIVGLEDKLNNFPNELSGGEQQRVAIARALVHRPR